MTLTRCQWAAHDPLLQDYHDHEWGRPVRGDTALFERITLEAFQSGLSWLIVLRKREAFRTAFAGFEPAVVAQFSDEDRARLLADAGIIRNRAKVDATLANARALLDLQRAEGEGALDRVVWSHRPVVHDRPADSAAIASTSPQSQALARELRAKGFRFVGPTTMYAAMQACGLVNDHVLGCQFAGD